MTAVVGRPREGRQPGRSRWPRTFDISPEGGARGGRVVAEGIPEEVARVAESHTARFLAQVLGGSRGKRRRTALA